jgi:hypothetical protein
VVTVFASQLSSFKVFSVGGDAGALTADRTHGVWGELGAEVTMVPVEVDASGRGYAFECVRHPVLLPLMVAYVTQACHAAHGRTFGEQTVAARVEVAYEDGTTVVLSNSFAQPDAPAMAAATASALLAYLEGSTFAAPAVERVRVELVAQERNLRAEIVDAVVDRQVVAPGDELLVRVRMQANQGEQSTERVRVRVPWTVAEGKLDLVVADGSSWAAYDLQMRPLRPASFADELRLVERLVPSTHLVLAFERPEVGVVMPGVTAAVPPSLVVGLRSGLGPNLGTTTHRVLQQDEVVLPHPVLGAQRLNLVVRADAHDLTGLELEEP